MARFSGPSLGSDFSSQGPACLLAVESPSESTHKEKKLSKAVTPARGLDHGEPSGGAIAVTSQGPPVRRGQRHPCASAMKIPGPSWSFCSGKSGAKARNLCVSQAHQFLIQESKENFAVHVSVSYARACRSLWSEVRVSQVHMSLAA